MQVFKYVEHLLILASAVTCYVSVSGFASLVCVSVGVTSFNRNKHLCKHCRN